MLTAIENLPLLREKVQRKMAVLVRPASYRLPSTARRYPAKAGEGIFVGVFGVDRLASLEGERTASHGRVLIADRHANASRCALCVVVNRGMVEGGEVEGAG